MDGRQEAFKALKDFGHKLVQEQHYARDEVEASLAQLEELRRTLGASWEERRHRLTQAHQRQLFDRQAQQAHAWLAAKEAFLNNDDLGVSGGGGIWGAGCRLCVCRRRGMFFGGCLPQEDM